MSKGTVKLKGNGVDCFYVVDDLCIKDGVLSFSIDSDLYVFKFSLEAFVGWGMESIIDCCKLTLLDKFNVEEVHLYVRNTSTT